MVIVPTLGFLLEDDALVARLPSSESPAE